jgi:homoserine dehydrogenase
MRRVPIVLLGPGAVGRALLGQLVAARRHHAEQLALRLAVIAVADRDAAVLAPSGELADGDLTALLDLKAAGGRLAAHPWAQPRTAVATGSRAGFDAAPIVVDTTAADTAAELLALRRHGWRVALANKLPLTGDRATFAELTRSGRGARWETTVGAALPVIAALQTRLDSGDRIHRISGTLSGTLGYVAKRLEEGGRLAAVVAEASQLGYLEPDPRTDLSGRDAARKTLILARMLGYELELPDVVVEGLYPPAWDELPVDAFLHRLPELDDALTTRSAAAARAGRALRFIATIEGESARAGLDEVDPASRLAVVGATDSIVIFETDHFRANPLVISGRGGGPEITAAGVLGDIVSLAREEG